MRTPAEYTKNLNNNIITREMLLDCLYSANKRAKNWRDKERQYRRYRYDYYDNEEKAREEKEYYYHLKDIMLSVISPVCIHRETIKDKCRERFYDYEEEYWEYQGQFIHTGQYWDNEIKEYVQFGDVILDCDPIYHYYLFYDLGGKHTFHTPISEEKVKDYDLPVIDISQLQTFGHDISDLISMQFVKKMIALISSANFSYMG